MLSRLEIAPQHTVKESEYTQQLIAVGPFHAPRTRFCILCVRASRPQSRELLVDMRNIYRHSRIEPREV